ncbi:hypothetical protein CDAR_14311 [Caerostris darwini]|uniref:Uncharacterized protein n=1 Tax=Caerostris darwini TaxID=1538125 RepID=A0AAV4QI20_9ARAC|nr:hypothetical protein CDAR_14311 [Caerostris darwini]
MGKSDHALLSERKEIRARVHSCAMQRGTNKVSFSRHGHSRFTSNINKIPKKKKSTADFMCFRFILTPLERETVELGRRKRRLETPRVHCLMAVYFITLRSSHSRSIVQKLQRKKNIYCYNFHLCLSVVSHYIFLCRKKFIVLPKNCCWKIFYYYYEILIGRAPGFMHSNAEGSDDDMKWFCRSNKLSYCSVVG